MSPGGLIDIENGTLRNGGWATTNWTNNQASMYIASDGILDAWDGQPINIDALNGSGLVTKYQGTNNVTLTVGVAGGSGSFSGVIESPQSGTPFNNNTAGSSISLVKSGSGLQILTGANTYTGRPPSTAARCKSATAAPGPRSATPAARRLPPTPPWRSTIATQSPSRADHRRWQPCTRPAPAC